MHQPSHSFGWHLLAPQIHHATKPIQSFNWASSAGTTSMPPVVPSRAPASGSERCQKLLFMMAVKKTRNPRDRKIKIHANFIFQ